MRTLLRPGYLRGPAAAALVGSCLILSAGPALAGDDAEPDVTPPVISNTGIEPGRLAPSTLRFTPTITDDVKVQQVETLVNGKLAGSCPQSTSTGAWNCAAPLHAKYAANDTDAEITVRATDPTGNQSESSTTVHVDNVRPTATISPTRAYTHSGTLPITFSDVSSDTASIWMNDGTVLTTTPWTFRWEATNGAANPCFELKDRAGNRTMMCSGYIVDDDPPVIHDVTRYGAYSTSTFAGGNGWVGRYNQLSPRVEDNSTMSYEWWVNGALQATGFDIYWDTRAITTPTATVELRVRDAVGNMASASYLVHVDNRGPVFTSILPANRALVRGTWFTTSIKVSDPAGIGYANLEGADGLNRPPYVHTSGKVESGQDGIRRVTWLAADNFDNQTFASRDVIVDNTLPALRITKAPRNKAKLSKNVTITAAASDRNGIARVQLLVGGKVVATDTKAGYSFVLNPKKYGKTFTIQLRTYDRAGNTRSTGKLTYRR